MSQLKKGNIVKFATGMKRELLLQEGFQEVEEGRKETNGGNKEGNNLTKTKNVIRKEG